MSDTPLNSSFSVAGRVYTLVRDGSYNSWLISRYLLFSRDPSLRDEIFERLGPSTLFGIQLSMASFSAGVVSGGYIGAQKRGMQFLAENAHRLPKTVAGWFYYHRYKNLEMVKAGGFSGLRYGLAFGTITASYYAIEEVLDRAEGLEAWYHSLIAGTSVAGVYAFTARLSRGYLKYALLTGSGVGLLIGGLQEGYRRWHKHSFKSHIA